MSDFFHQDPWIEYSKSRRILHAHNIEESETKFMGPHLNLVTNKLTKGQEWKHNQLGEDK